MPKVRRCAAARPTISSPAPTAAAGSKRPAGEVRQVQEQQRQERQRGRVGEAVPPEQCVSERERGPEACGHDTRESAPETAGQRVQRPDLGEREQPDSLLQHRRGRPGHQEMGPVEGRHPRVLPKRHAEHPVRVVDQQRSVARDLVGVQHVFRPVVSGHGCLADHPVLDQQRDDQRGRAACGRQRLAAIEAKGRLAQRHGEPGGHKRRRGEPHRHAGQLDSDAGHRDQHHARRRDPQRRRRRKRRRGALSRRGRQQRKQRETGGQHERHNGQRAPTCAQKREQRLANHERRRGEGKRAPSQAFAHRIRVYRPRGHEAFGGIVERRRRIRRLRRIGRRPGWRGTIRAVSPAGGPIGVAGVRRRVARAGLPARQRAQRRRARARHAG